MSRLNLWFTNLEKGRQEVLLEDKWMLAEASWTASKKEILEEISECDCMGEVSKVLREHGIG